MLQPRAGQLAGAKQGAKRAARVGLHLKRSTAVRTSRARVEKGVDLLLQQLSLKGAEELFGLRQRQTEVLDALGGLVEGDHIGDGFFMALIVTDDELEFDTHRAPPGSRNRGMIQAILPEFFAYPQHLHALLARRSSGRAAPAAGRQQGGTQGAAVSGKAV
jgi:hypothetical protein